MSKEAVPSTPIDLELPPRGLLEDAIHVAASAAGEAGASDWALSASTHAGLSLGLRAGEVESLEFQRDRELGITVYFGQRKGHAGTADFRPEAIAEAVRAACSIARHTQDDAANGLPDAAQLATEFPDLQLDYRCHHSLDTLKTLGQACEARGLADAAIDSSDGLHLNASRQLSLLHNSHGFSGWSQGSHYGLSLSLIGADASGKRRDYWYASSLDDSALAQGERVADTAIARVRAGLNPRQPKTGVCSVLFPPQLARGLIGHFLSAISGRALYQRSTFLLEAMDTAVFSPGMQIHQRPHRPRQFGCASFDAEGVATQDRDLVADGQLRGWLLGSYAARRLGLQSTGNAGGPQRIEVMPTTSADQRALMREAGSGLLLTSLMGQGVNIATGQYSRGLTGIWFENGEPAYPVHECTIGGNLKDMFRAIRAVGSDVDEAASIATGTLWVDGLTVAGQ